MAKFTFTRDYDEKQPGGKRRWKAWKAGQTYVMTKQHATDLQENGYGYCHETDERTGDQEGSQGPHDPLA